MNIEERRRKEIYGMWLSEDSEIKIDFRGSLSDEEVAYINFLDDCMLIALDKLARAHKH